MLSVRCWMLDVSKLMSDPIIDLHSDDYFMGEALRQAAKACEKDEVPVGAVVVRAGRIFARAFKQVEELRAPPAHAEILAPPQRKNRGGGGRLAFCPFSARREPCPMC